MVFFGKKTEQKGDEAATAAAAEAEALRIRTEREQKAYKDLQWIAHIMDDAFKVPCTKDRRVGLDPIIGLVPGLGDMASACVSLVFILRASPLLRKRTISRMLCNVGVDFFVGLVPLFGDLFDFYFKANNLNLKIFEAQMHEVPPGNSQNESA